MHKLRIYLDTSVFGVTEDVKTSEATRRLLDAIEAGKYVVLVSPETARELDAAPEEVRRLFDRIPTSSRESLSFSDEVQSLADAYIAASLRITTATRGTSRPRQLPGQT